MDREKIEAIIIVILIIGIGFTFIDNSEKGNKINVLTETLDQTAQSLSNEQQENAQLTSKNINLNETLVAREIELRQKDGKIKDLNSEINELSGELEEKEETIENQSQTLVLAGEKINELKDTTSEQQNRIQNLLASQESEQGKLVVDEYGGTMILYDNQEIYSKFQPMMSVVSSQSIQYSKLGIPFIYFKDEHVTINESSIILGQYSGLYDYIFIFRDASSAEVIYHEIAHIIFKNLFQTNPTNLNTWNSHYTYLKDNNLLSSAYAYSDEIEGFCEEYAAYKMNSNPDQSEATRDLLAQVDQIILGL